MCVSQVPGCVALHCVTAQRQWGPVSPIRKPRRRHRLTSSIRFSSPPPPPPFFCFHELFCCLWCFMVWRSGGGGCSYFWQGWEYRGRRGRSVTPGVWELEVRNSRILFFSLFYFFVLARSNEPRLQIRRQKTQSGGWGGGGGAQEVQAKSFLTRNTNVGNRCGRGSPRPLRDP